MNITNDYNDTLISNCTNIDENDDDIFMKAMMFVIPSGILFFFNEYYDIYFSQTFNQ